MRTRTACLIMALLIPAGCGYTFGARLPEGINTLEVPVFRNMTLIRDLEFMLTEALTEELKSRTPVKLVSSDGDARLTGSVIEYEKTPVYEEAGEVVAGKVTIVVAFKFTRTAEEKAICESTLAEAQDFDSRTGKTEHDARKAAVQELARKIVYHIEAW